MNYRKNISSIVENIASKLCFIIQSLLNSSMNLTGNMKITINKIARFEFTLNSLCKWIYPFCFSIHSLDSRYARVIGHKNDYDITAAGSHSFHTQRENKCFLPLFRVLYFAFPGTPLITLEILTEIILSVVSFTTLCEVQRQMLVVQDCAP